MSPKDTLLDRIDKLRDLAELPHPDGDKVNALLADIRTYFAACGAVHREKKQNGLSAGTYEQARDLYK